MEQRLSLVTLGVADVAASTAFYRRLGWRPSERFAGEEISFFDLGGVVLALFQREALIADARAGRDGEGFRGVALAHNVHHREEVEEELRRAEEAGARILKPATEADWGGVSGYFADPDGHLWEIAWNPHFPLDVDGRVVLPD